MGEYFNSKDLKLYFDQERMKREIEFNRYLEDVIFRGDINKVLNKIPKDKLIPYIVSKDVNLLMDNIPEELLNNYVRDKKLKKIIK